MKQIIPGLFAGSIENDSCEVHEDSRTTSTVFNKTETMNHIPSGLLLDFKSLQSTHLAL